MAKFNTIQNSFRSGELGPRLIGRTNSENYKEACEEVLNFLPIKQGGLTRRMGSRFIYAALDRPAIIPFVFSKTEGYGIFMNHLGQQATVLAQDGTNVQTRVSTVELAGKTLSDWSNWITDLDPNGWHHTQTGDILILVHSTGTVPPICIKRVENPDYTPTAETDHSLYSHIGTVFEIDWYLASFHFDYPDRRQILRWAFQPINIEEKYLRFIPLGNNEFILVSFDDQSATTLLRDFWDEKEVGSIIRVTPYQTNPSPPPPNVPNNVEFAFEILSLSGDILLPGSSYPAKSSQAICRLIHPEAAPTLTSDTQFVTRDWKRSYWSDYNGWPKSITQYEQRLFFGGNKQFPDTIWGSVEGNVFHMMVERFEQDKGVDNKKDDITGLDYFGVQDPSDPLDFTAGASEANKIQWLSGQNALMVGTIGAEYMLTGGTDGLTADNAFFRKQTATGSSDVMPAFVDKDVLFVSRTGRRLYDLTTDPVKGVSQGRDLNILNEDIIKHRSEDLESIEKIVSQTSINTVWALTSANQLLGFTLSAESNTSAWHRHTIGNSAEIKSIGVIPSQDGRFDDLWISASRDGLGIKMLRTGPSIAGLNIIAVNLTGHVSITDYLASTTSKDSTQTSIDGTFKRRGIIKLDEDITGADLAAAYFGFDDTSPQSGQWNIWYNDNAAPAPAGPDIAGTFEEEVKYNVGDDRATIIANTVDAISKTRYRIKATATEAGEVTPGLIPASSISHFQPVTLTSSYQFSKMLTIIPQGSFPSDMDTDLLGEYFYLAAPGAPERHFRFWFSDGATPDPDVATPVTSFHPIVITPNMDATDIINKMQTVIDSVIDAGISVFKTEVFSPFTAQDGYETIERIGENFSHDKMFNTSTKEADKPYFVDSSVRRNLGAPGSSFDTFDHLNEETVQVLADGFYIGDYLVVGGIIDISPKTATEVIAGYGYTSRLKTLPIEIGADFGSAIGVIQRIDKATLLLYKTFGPMVGYELAEMEDLELLPPDYASGDPLPLFSGRYEMDFPASPDDLQFVIVEQTKPYPVTVLAINMRGRTYDQST